MKLVVADRLKPEERSQLAIAARKNRPNARYRAQLRKLLARRRRELKLASKPSEDAA
jgi:hypothetical protein